MRCDLAVLFVLGLVVITALARPGLHDPENLENKPIVNKTATTYDDGFGPVINDVDANVNEDAAVGIDTLEGYINALEEFGQLENDFNLEEHDDPVIVQPGETMEKAVQDKLDMMNANYGKDPHVDKKLNQKPYTWIVKNAAKIKKKILENIAKDEE